MEMSQLSESEIKMIELLAQGKTLIQIADVLHLKFTTVKSKACAIYKKLNVENKCQLVAQYWRNFYAA